MAELFRWGIIGPGNIAGKFAEGLTSVEGARLYAAASRTPGRAEQFISQWDGEKAYASYEEILADDKVDALYVATPHSFHLAHAKAALEAGIPVLCEKPMTLSESQTKELVETARKERVFLMEAMWSRFFPLMDRIRNIIKEGVIGDVRMAQADFGFRCPVNPTGRLFDPKLGGGSLLDVGVYPISFFQMLLGEPETVQGTAYIGETGVDEQCAFVLGYGKGQIALGSSAVRTETPREARIMGTEGRIHIPENWWSPNSITLYKDGQAELIENPFKGNGYNYEAEAVMKDVRAGKRENSLMPLEDSLAIARTMDKLRVLWGITYPGE